MNNTNKLKAIDALLDRVPTFQCIEGCADCCGPVAMTALEWRRIIERTGDRKLPQKVAQAAAASLSGGDGRCPLLVDNRCSVYDIRPAICRVFGSSSDHTAHANLRCPHGRAPSNPLTPEQTSHLMNSVELLGGASVVTFKLTDFVRKKLNI